MIIADYIIENDILTNYVGPTDVAVIEIPDGVKIISKSFFSSNCNATTLVLHDSVEEIYMDGAFEWHNLSKIVGGKNVKVFVPTRLKCELLEKEAIIVGSVLVRNHNKNVIVPDHIKTIASDAFKTDWIESFDGYSVAHESKLEDIMFSDSVEEIGVKAFKGALIETINLPHNLKYIGDECFRSSMIIEIKIPESVTTIGHSAFSYTRHLKKIEYNNNLKKVPGISYSSVEEIKFSENCVDIGEISNCDNLKQLIIPSNVDIKRTIAYQCKNLRDIYIDERSVQEKVSALKDCENATIHFYDKDINNITCEIYCGFNRENEAYSVSAVVDKVLSFYNDRNIDEIFAKHKSLKDKALFVIYRLNTPKNLSTEMKDKYIKYLKRMRNKIEERLKEDSRENELGILYSLLSK